MSDLFPDSVILIFAKAPVLGQVKTRLQPEMTLDEALSAHIELTKMTLNRAFEASICPVKLYCAPNTEHVFFKSIARNFPVQLVQQNGDDLGQRMANAFIQELFIYRHVILIGCDCPSLTSADFHFAFRALHEGYDVVVAPAEDGGYVLLGMNAYQVALFQDMPWSSPQLMPQTRRAIQEAGLQAFEMPMQWDVDVYRDWQRFLSNKKMN